MSLRDELNKEMDEAAQRIPPAMEQTVYGVGPATDDPIEGITNVLRAQMEINRIYSKAILRLAEEIERLTAS